MSPDVRQHEREIFVTENSKKTLLIIDDDQELVSLLKMRFELEGYSVLTAYDGEDGLHAAREKKPDLVILDVMMPQMDGFHVCRLLKFDLKTDRTPIILLTARTTPKDQAIGQDVGSNFYLTKPFEFEDLRHSVQKLLT